MIRTPGFSLAKRPYDPSGTIVTYTLGVNPGGIRLIPAHENFYWVDLLSEKPTKLRAPRYCSARLAHRAEGVFNYCVGNRDVFLH